MERPRFLEELSRRHVYKVAAVYAVVAWVVIQIAATALPYLLDRPDPVIKIIIILSLVGFPIALVLGWVFDVTPEGVQRTDAQAAATTAHRPPAAPNRARIVAVGSLFVAAVAVGFALWYVRENAARPADAPVNSISDQIQKRLLESLDRHPEAVEGLNRRSEAAGGASGTPLIPNVDSVLRATAEALRGLGTEVGLHVEGPVPAHMNRIAVFPFEVPGTGADARWGETVSDSLSAALAAAGHGIVDPVAVRKAVGKAGTSGGADDHAARAALARQLGADAFITGRAVPQAGIVILNVAFSSVAAPNDIRRADGVIRADSLRKRLAGLAGRLTHADASPTP
ncbi:MAG: hypothetical protein P8099_14150 [Gemmatimonadota bacterium]